MKDGRVARWYAFMKFDVSEACAKGGLVGLPMDGVSIKADEPDNCLKEVG